MKAIAAAWPLTMTPTPGHTPGHVSVLIASNGAQACISGDFLHHPCQLAHPEWSSFFDADPQQSASTRARMLALLADRPMLLLGTHFAGPVAGRVVRDGAAYGFAVDG